MKHTFFRALFVVGLLCQAGSVAGVEAEYGGTTKAGVRRATKPLFMASYRETSNYQEESIQAGRGSRRSPGFEEEATSLRTESDYHDFNRQIYGISPSVGAVWWGGGWGPYVSNQFSLGLNVDFPMSRILSLEVESGYGNYRTHYNNPITGHHTFDQLSMGGNAKVYLWRGFLSPYVGGGMALVYYNGLQTMARGPFGRVMPLEYNYWMGNGQVMAGTDINVSPGVSVGVRGSWFLPLINRPYTIDAIGGPTGTVATPGSEEAAMLNQSYFRLLGNVRVIL